MEQFKAVIFEKDELECQNMSKLKALWAYWDSYSTVGNKNHTFRKKTLPKAKGYRLTHRLENRAGGTEKM